jgi:hypothetical protein
MSSPLLTIRYTPKPIGYGDYHYQIHTVHIPAYGAVISEKYYNIKMSKYVINHHTFNSRIYYSD